MESWRLELYWYEIEGNQTDRIGRYCGELLGATNDLVLVREQLQKAIRRRSLSQTFECLDYESDNYLHRAYIVRERALGAMTALVGKGLGGLKNHSTRRSVADGIRSTAPDVTDALVRLFDLLDQDLPSRNRITHETFLHLGLYAGGTLYEPGDVLMDVARSPHEPGVRRSLRKAAKQFVDQYVKTIDNVMEAAYRFVEEMDKATQHLPREDD